MLASVKKYIAPLLISLFSMVVIVLDSRNLYNEWLYTFFYSGLLTALTFALVQQHLSLTATLRVGIFAVVFASLFLRIHLFPFQSADFTKNFALWMDEITVNGGLLALKNPFYDYSPPFMYILVLLTKLPFSKLVGLKAASLVFEYTAAVLVFGIVKQFRSSITALLAAALFLFLPTVVMNGALWGQCDSMYTCLLLGFVYFLLCRKNFAALLFFSFAFAFKLQTVFILLLPLALVAHQHIPFRLFFLIPVIYLLAVLPVALAGRPLIDLLTIYLGQAGSTAHLLTANAPSVYAFIPYADPALFGTVGVLFTAALVLTFFILFLLKKNTGDTNDFLLFTAALSVLIIPYFLPRMHERYFYPADVFLFVLAFRWPKLWWAPVLCGLASLFSYFPFLFDQWPIDFRYLSSALLLLVLLLTRFYLNLFFTANPKPV